MNLNVGTRGEPKSSFPGAVGLCLAHMLLLKMKTDLQGGKDGWIKIETGIANKE